jgi:hypothetical protein
MTATYNANTPPPPPDFEAARSLMAVPFAARRLRVLADWTAAGVFRRDVAELTAVGGGR